MRVFNKTKLKEAINWHLNNTKQNFVAPRSGLSVGINFLNLKLTFKQKRSVGERLTM